MPTYTPRHNVERVASNEVADIEVLVNRVADAFDGSAALDADLTAHAGGAAVHQATADQTVAPGASHGPFTLQGWVDRIANRLKAITGKASWYTAPAATLEDAATHHAAAAPHAGHALSAHAHAHADTTGRTANDHHNQAHALNGADHTGTLGAAQIADGGIATAKLAANAVTQTGLANGGASNPTTTSTTFVDVDSMAVTLTTTGGELLVQATITSSHGSGLGTIQFALALDGGGEVGIVQRTLTNANDQVVTSLAWRFAGVAAGSHTVKLRWLVGSGTGTATGTMRTLVVTELKK